MRKITSLNGSPVDFEKWVEANHEILEEKFNNPSVKGKDIWNYFRNDKGQDEYKSLKKNLIEDQGFICCYCGQRISNDHTTLIEHLKPKSTNKQLTFDFDNLLASCMGGSLNKVHIVQEGETLESISDRFGVNVEHLYDVYVNIDEIKLFRTKYDIEDLKVGDRVVIFPIVHDKDDLHCDKKKNSSEIEIITPLMDDCADYFDYNYLNGEITTNKEIDKDKATKAETTINLLGLNSNRYINNLRIRAIRESNILMSNLINDFGHSPIEFNLNRQKLIENLDNVSFNDGKLEPFVFVMVWNFKIYS